MDALAQVLLLTGAVVVPVVLVFKHPARRPLVRETLVRAITGLAAAAFVFTIPFGLFACSCGPGNNPVRQTAVPAFGALVCAAAVGPARLRVVAVAALLTLSTGLAWHFNRLVMPGDESCRFTGDPAFVANSCPQPIAVGRAWYTPLTGLHPLRRPRP